MVHLGLDEPSIRRAEPSKTAEELNGTFKSIEPDKAQQDLDVKKSSTQSHAMENGLSETDTPHGSTMGSNGYILSKAQDDLPATQHRTNWSLKGTSAVGYAAKTLPLSATSQTQGQEALRTNTSTGPSLAEGRLENETKNGTATNTPPRVTVHRARKTMSRPASNHALKVISKGSTTFMLTYCMDKDSESQYQNKPFSSIMDPRVRSDIHNRRNRKIWHHATKQGVTINFLCTRSTQSHDFSGK